VTRFRRRQPGRLARTSGHEEVTTEVAAVNKALIVGGGPAGLCAATVLQKRGIDVEIAEINADLRPLGSGLAMMGPSLRALRMVDGEALERCIHEGFGHHSLSFGTGDGQIVQRVELPRAAGPEYPGGCGTMRPVFWGLLAETAQKAGARIRLSTTVTAIKPGAGNVNVTLSDGSSAAYDLLVGADGLHSKVRDLAFPDVPQPFFTGQTVWRVILPRADEISDGIVMYYGPRNKVGCNPVSDKEMYIFVVENTPEITRPPQEEWPTLVQALLAEYGGVIAWARGQATDPGQIDRRPLHAILVRPPWYRERVLLIGDAAHSTTPQLAMGAGIAIEDAVVLGDVLGSHADLGDALAEFMERRWERCRLVVENSLQLGEWEKHPDDPQADPAGLTDASLAALAGSF
jgi:2-polyprenyl-6-methoxyphenol hydroxylase-like FAD-dependent oxidoreductase